MPMKWRQNGRALSSLTFAFVCFCLVFALTAPSVGSATAAAVSSSRAAQSVPQYTWPEFHQNNTLSGVTADPAISTTSAPTLGVRWMTNTGSLILSSPMAGYNAALNETLVFAGNEAGYETAFNQATGVPVWSDNLGSPIRSSPLVEGRNVWVEPARAYRLYKLNAATGAVECSAPTPLTENVDSSPMIATPPGGSPTVYIGNNDTGKLNGPLTAVNEADCAINFSVSPEPVAGSGGIWDPISYGVDASGVGVVYFGTADPDSAIYAINAITGKLIWRYAVYNPPPGTYDVGAGLTVSPPGVNGFSDGVVYAASKYGIMYALDMTTGQLIWQYNFGAQSGIVPPGALSTAALVGRHLVLGNGGGVTSLNPITGAFQWRYSDHNTLDVDSSVLVSGPPGGQVVSFTTQTGQVRVISLATGSLLYSYQTANFMVTSPADANGNLIVTSGDGYLYDFAPGGGKGPAPTTAVTSPADGSTIPNPAGSATITGTAADPSGAVAAVTVAIQRNGTNGQWWDSTSGNWVAAPYPNPATLGSPGGTTTTWSLSVPTSPAGGGYEVFASAVNSTGVADVSAEQSPPSAARVNFTVEPSPPPHITLSSTTEALGQTVVVSGTGFGASEQVSLSLSGAVVATGETDTTGDLNATSVVIPTTTSFGPQTMSATGQMSGLTTTAPLYISDPWDQYLAGPTHEGADVLDNEFNQHLSVSSQTYLSESWSFNTGSALSGSVSVVDGIAYAGTTAGQVYAVNVQTGTEEWGRTVASSAIVGSPALNGNSLVFASAGGTVQAVTAKKGSPTWSTTLPDGAAGTSPTVVDGTVYVVSEGSDSSVATVYALKESSGSILWQHELVGTSVSSPAVDPVAGMLFVGDASGRVSALKAKTGTVVWSYSTGAAVNASPMVYGGNVYVGSVNGNEYDLNEGTGTEVWTEATGGPVNSAAVLVPGSPFAVAVGSSHATYYLSPTTGVPIFTVTVGSPIAGLGVAVGFVAMTESDGQIIGSKPQATDPYAWEVTLAGSFISAPIVVNGAVYFAGQNGMITCYVIPGQQPA